MSLHRIAAVLLVVGLACATAAIWTADITTPDRLFASSALALVVALFTALESIS